MAIVKKTYKGTPLDSQQEFVCDYRADVASLPTQTTEGDQCPTGSEAFVIEDSSAWMLNSEGVWADLDGGGSGTSTGSGNGTTTIIEGTVEIIESDSASYAKVYTVKQSGNTVGVINIPKDMVIQSGQIVENPAGQAAGKYLELTLANSDNTKIYISVSDLVDVYTVQESATEIQLAISDTNEISATIVAGSVDSTKLSTDVNDTLNSVAVHIATTIPSEAGAHGLRYYNNTLQYHDGTDWVTLSLSNLLL